MAEQNAMAKWIDLNDPSGARLKLASIDVAGHPVRHIFVTNLAWSNPKWREAIRRLGFREPPSRRYLVRRVAENEQLTLSFFRQVFPGARMVLMAPKDYILGFGKSARAEENHGTQVDLRGVVRLGRNAQGHNVYESLSGRFWIEEFSGQRVDESPARHHEEFLRLAPAGSPIPDGVDFQEALTRLAGGLVQSMRHGEPLHSENLQTFIRAAWGGDEPTPEELATRMEQVQRALDEALLRYLHEVHDTPALAYGEAARLHGYQPTYMGEARGVGAMPLPLAIVAQRLLGDTAGKTVVLPNIWDGALAAFLDKDCDLRAYQVQPAHHLRLALPGGKAPEVRDESYSPIVCAAADALLFNADPRLDSFGQREDYRLALLSLRQLRAGARAVLVLAGDDENQPGEIAPQSLAFMRQLAQRYVIDDCWETAPILSRKNGGTRGLRLVALRAEAPDGQQVQRQMELLEHPLPVYASWDAIKSHVDERIESIKLTEAQSRQQGAQREDEGDYQRPYMAFSRLGEARTMVPANLAAPIQQYLTELEKRYGGVDEMVARELGMGINTLAARFSPEQIDGIAIMLSRLLIGRSSILADDTGIGKGRQLAALAVWANKRGEDVYFVTDRANLFSDMARDLNDIGEWGRFAPLVFNADGEITIDVGPGEPPRVLAKGESPQAMRRLLEEGKSLRDIGRNICFLTYSQISAEESEKARWLKNNVGSGLVIFDEAHIAAGSDSNIARHVAEIAAAARHVQFASATWAKTPDNLHIYQAAFPHSVSISTLSATMRKGGESFSEIFSAMLATEGALIRREHDLSRLEVELFIDEQNRSRNEFVSDKVADVLGAAAYLVGEMEQVFIRVNADSVRRLREAREARDEVVPRRVNFFSSNFGTGSVIYQIMKGVQGALNADHVAHLAVESLRKGLKPVIVTDATNESLLERFIERDRQGQEQPLQASDSVRMPTLRDLLRDVILRRITTVRVREVDAEEVLSRESQDTEEAEEHAEQEQAQPEGARRGRQAAQPEDEELDVAQAWRRARGDEEEGDGNEAEGAARRSTRMRYREVSIFEIAAMTPELREIYERGITEIEHKIDAVPDIPLSAIDIIEQTLRNEGFRVGEITGRKFQLVQTDAASNGWTLHPRITHKRGVKATIKAFNDGQIDALVINRAAAAGVSLHASPRFGDRSRRHLIEHMIPEDPVNRIQLLGRVNRYDQLSSPLITTASTGIYGEVRYLMMQNRKLARLSANVRSSRDNAMSLKGVVDLFNSVGAEAIRSYLSDSPLVARRLGFTEDDIENAKDIVNQATMRIPLLTVNQQRQVYDEIYSRFEEILVRAELEGSNPLKPTELDVRARSEQESVFMGDDGQDVLSAFDAPVYVRTLSWDEMLTPLSWDSVKAAALASRERLIEAGTLERPVEDSAPVPQAPGLERINADAEEFVLWDSWVPQDAQEQAQRENRDDDLLALFNSNRANSRARAKADVACPKLSAQIAEAVQRGFEGLLRVAHMSSGIDDLHEAAQKSASVRRAAIVHHWIAQNLHKLVPGAGLHWIATQNDESFHSEYVITDVEPPANQNEWMHLGKWKITVVTPGAERGRVFTLRSILSEVDGKVFRGEMSGELRVTATGFALNDGIYGMRAVRLAHQFDMAPYGRRRRHSTMLCGNLYLASEWAAATGKGRAVIYTDENGIRHRGIQLPQDMEAVRADFLPVRVADPLAQTMLFNRLMSRPRWTDDVPEYAREVLANRSGHTLDLTFRSAMRRARSTSLTTHGKPDAVIVFVPGECIGLSMAPQDLRRVAGAIRAAQKSLMKQQNLDQAHDPGYVKVSQFTRINRGVPLVVARAVADIRVETRVHGLGVAGDTQGQRERSAGVLLLRVQNAEQTQRALKILTESAGLEIYAVEQPYRALAQDAIRDAMRTRRQQLREAQELARQEATTQPTEVRSQDAEANTLLDSDAPRVV